MTSLAYDAMTIVKLFAVVFTYETSIKPRSYENKIIQ